MVGDGTSSVVHSASSCDARRSIAQDRKCSTAG